MNINPANTKWKSLKYRRFIRNHLQCVVPGCDKEFLDEPESYEAHHHKTNGSGGSTGGKNPSDQLLVPLCRVHHSEFHSNQSAFMKKRDWDENLWLSLCINTLEQYLETFNINAKWVEINALQKAAEENEA